MLKILLNLRSDVVDISLVEQTIDKKKKRRVKIVKEYHIDPKDGFEKVVEEIKKNSNSKVAEIICVLGNSFATSKTYVINRQFDRPTLLKQSLLDEILAQNSTKGAFERINLHTSVNGYETKNPVNKEVTSVDLTIFESKARTELIEEVTQSFSKLAHHIIFTTLPALLFKYIHSSQAIKNSNIFIEVQHETTVISYMEDNRFLKTSSFALGTEAILKEIEKRLNVDVDAALSLIKMKKEKVLEQVIESRLDLALEQSFLDWKKEFDRVIKEVCVSSYNNHYYIFGDESFILLYDKIIIKYNLTLMTFPIKLYDII